jgi:hypothetical protein
VVLEAAKGEAVIWTVRDVTEPQKPSTFEHEMDDPGMGDEPAVDDFISVGSMVYKITAVYRDERLVEVVWEAGPATAGR